MKIELFLWSQHVCVSTGAMQSTIGLRWSRQRINLFQMAADNRQEQPDLIQEHVVIASLGHIVRFLWFSSFIDGVGLIHILLCTAKLVMFLTFVC